MFWIVKSRWQTGTNNNYVSPLIGPWMTVVCGPNSELTEYLL
jgi:hypothetical protein